MAEEKKVATLVRKLRGSWSGDARLYRLEPPLPAQDWDGNETGGEYSQVIVSAVVVQYTGKPETYIFPATADGEIASWNELPGSFQGDLDHAAALRGAGYEVAS
ncbi:hypothetical protein [Microbacterium gilvum]|uniref:Uncharacterized protein n=1 Tax=Microbacterium gilvum TaxID=1336204 RepID=A0ABP8ZQB2_9MICO